MSIRALELSDRNSRMNTTMAGSLSTTTTSTTTTAVTTGAGAERGLDLTSTLAGLLEMGVDVAVDRTKKAFADDLDVSPVTLSSDWSRVARLLLLASLAVVGSVGNVFMISAVMVEDHLKKRGEARASSIDFLQGMFLFSCLFHFAPPKDDSNLSHYLKKSRNIPTHCNKWPTIIFKRY